MKATYIGSAAAIALALAAPLAVAADQTVSDGSFNQQVQTVKEQLQMHEGQGQGVYGPAGIRSEEAGPGSTVRGRDIDRYVQRLAVETKARNQLGDRDPTGFQ